MTYRVSKNSHDTAASQKVCVQAYALLYIVAFCNPASQAGTVPLVSSWSKSGKCVTEFESSVPLSARVQAVGKRLAVFVAKAKHAGKSICTCNNTALWATMHCSVVLLQVTKLKIKACWLHRLSFLLQESLLNQPAPVILKKCSSLQVKP